MERRRKADCVYRVSCTRGDPERERSEQEGREKEGLVRIILASVYRSEAWANQTDIIDLTCDLEIRKIADGEGLEPIIIVNTGRPSPFYLPLPPLSYLFPSLFFFNG